jgi:tight adherence protein B
MSWALATLLIAGAALAARPAGAARERLSGRRPGLDLSAVRPAVLAVLDGPRWRPVLAASGTAAVVAGLAGGPVAGLVAAAYAGLGVHEWRRRTGRRRAEARRAAYLDELASLVAELRAGIPAAVVAAGRDENPADVRLGRLTGAVWGLAERTGAPAADLLDRIESDARSADRSARTAAAQAAGAQTTAMLLAALPVGGIGLGYLIGADPLAVLLHTPWGAACAVAALLLQCAGLKWAQRLTEGIGR